MYPGLFILIYSYCSWIQKSNSIKSLPRIRQSLLLSWHFSYFYFAMNAMQFCKMWLNFLPVLFWILWNEKLSESVRYGIIWSEMFIWAVLSLHLMVPELFLGGQLLRKLSLLYFGSWLTRALPFLVNPFPACCWHNYYSPSFAIQHLLFKRRLT